jgi:Helix-turn-helix domain
MSSEDKPEAPGAPEPPDDEPLNLTDPRAMRALAHPVRIALIELLGTAGTITATQASEILGETPANCAFHLRTLAKYGFVREAGGGRGRERPWTRTRRSLRISPAGQADARAAVAAGALSLTWFDQWVERARRSIGSGPMPGWDDASGFSRSGLVLTRDEAAKVYADIQQLLERYRDRERDPSLRPPGALPVEVVYYVSPRVEFAPLVDKSQDIS